MSKGLSRDTIVAEAVAYIQESEQEVLSLHRLAERLGVKTPSLYNHIRNTEDLRQCVLQYAVDQFVQRLQQATDGKTGDEAVVAYAQAYYAIAREYQGLYRLIMAVPGANGPEAQAITLPVLDTVVTLLRCCGLSPEDIPHWQRVFRAILHGFIAQEQLGSFYYYQDISEQESLNIAVHCFLDGLHCWMRKKGK